MPLDTTPSYPFPGEQKIRAAVRDLADVLGDLPNNTRFANPQPDRTQRMVLASELVDALAKQKSHTKAAAAHAIHRLLTATLLVGEAAVEPEHSITVGGRTEDLEHVLAVIDERPFDRSATEPKTFTTPAFPLHQGDGPVPYEALLIRSTDALWRENSDASTEGPPESEGEATCPVETVELGPEFEPVRNWLAGRYLSDPTPDTLPPPDGRPIVYERYEPFRDYLLGIGAELVCAVDHCMAAGWIWDLYADISLTENPTPPAPGIARLNLPVGRHRLIGIRPVVLTARKKPALSPSPISGKATARNDTQSPIPMLEISTRPASEEPDPQALALAMQAVVEEMKLAVRARAGPVENGRRVVRYGDLTGRTASKGFALEALEWAIHRHREAGRISITPGHAAVPTVIDSGSTWSPIPPGGRSVSRQDGYLCPAPTLFDWWYKPRQPGRVFPSPYHELADVLHELFWMALFANKHGWEFDPSQINPMTNPWEPLEQDARRTSVGRAIPFAAFDPVLTDGLSELRRLVQLASGNRGVPFSALDRSGPELVRRLRELGETYAGAFAPDALASASLATAIDDLLAFVETIGPRLTDETRKKFLALDSAVWREANLAGLANMMPKGLEHPVFRLGDTNFPCNVTTGGNINPPAVEDWKRSLQNLRTVAEKKAADKREAPPSGRPAGEEQFLSDADVRERQERTEASATSATPTPTTAEAKGEDGSGSTADPIDANRKPKEGAKPKNKGGRPSDTDKALRRRIVDAWETGRYPKYEDLARELGVAEREVKLAVDAARKLNAKPS